MIAHHITTEQRDRLIARADELDDWAERIWWGRPAFGPLPSAYKRYRSVASRIRRFIRNGADMATPGIDANEAFANGEISEAEWIERLRWLALDARAGWTCLPPELEARRELRLSKAAQSANARRIAELERMGSNELR